MPFAFCEQLPSRLEWEMFNGDFVRYEESLYQIFQRDFVVNRLVYQGKPVDIIHEQYYNGKERSFWHIVTSGQEDFTRSFDEERCGSMPWARGLIEGNADCQDFKVWVKWHDQTKKDRHYIWCSKVNYMVILEDRGAFFKLITAFNVQPYNVARYQKDYEVYCKTKTPT